MMTSLVDVACQVLENPSSSYCYTLVYCAQTAGLLVMLSAILDFAYGSSAVMFMYLKDKAEQKLSIQDRWC